MSAISKKITWRQAAAIKALMESGTIEQAAKQAGVSTKTIYRWRQDPLFMAALDQAVSDQIGDAVRALVVDQQANHKVMREIRDKPNSSPAIRLRAATALDASLLKWRDLGDFELRLSRLEAVHREEQT